MSKARDLADNALGSKPKVVDAKGDLMVASTADTVIAVTIGTNGQFLKADSATTSGVSWATLTIAADDDQFILAGQIFG